MRERVITTERSAPVFTQDGEALGYITWLEREIIPPSRWWLAFWIFIILDGLLSIGISIWRLSK